MAEGITGGSTLEQEIARIEQELAVKREALSHQQEGRIPHEKETLHKVVGEMIHPERTPHGAPPQAAKPPAAGPSATGAAPTPLPQQVQQQVQALVNTAFDTSINAAIKAVKETDNAALIDAFHDILVDELYNHLVERGKLKRI